MCWLCDIERKEKLRKLRVEYHRNIGLYREETKSIVIKEIHIKRARRIYSEIKSLQGYYDTRTIFRNAGGKQ